VRRVLFHLSNAFSLEQKIGGAETAALTIMKGLRELGWQPHVLMHGQGLLAEQLDRSGIPWHVMLLPAGLEGLSRNQEFMPIRCAFALPGLMSLTRVVSKLMREWDIDIVHAHHMYAYLSCGIAAKKRGVPCVWHLHESWQPGFLARFLTQSGGLLLSQSQSTKLPPSPA
jgi:UDP-N-acetylglucosamine:LPS N-acetylglucosamine transferase